MKTYRINESEHFNLMSMYDHLKAVEIDMDEGTIPYDSALGERIEEVEHLLEKASCVGSLVDLATLKRIREIKNERQMIRYTRAIASGASENDAANAFNL